MWKRLPVHFQTSRLFSSESEVPALYSFLQPTIFAALRQRPSPPEPDVPAASPPPPPDAAALESAIRSSASSPDDAWRSFKTLAANSLPPTAASAADDLISRLAGTAADQRLSLKRAFAAAVFLLEKSPNYPPISPTTLLSLLNSLSSASAFAPALALIKSAFKNRFYPQFSLWGPVLISMAKSNPNSFSAFLNLFESNCRIAVDEKIDELKPNLDCCNEVLDGCCRILNSVQDAEKVLEILSALDLAPNLNSFASLAYLYAVNGLASRIEEVDQLLDSLGYTKTSVFFRNLITGYSKSGQFELVSTTILRALKEASNGNELVLDEETYLEFVNLFIQNGKLKDLATLIIQTQELESSKDGSVGIDNSVGYGIISACIKMGWLDKAHIMLEEMISRGASVGPDVYSSILKAYCKDRRTAEAAQLVAEITAAGLQLDCGSYDALIDSAMSAHDFQSAFSLFRDMREMRMPDLKTSYLTIMTGLMENHRPELMAAFVDSVVDDPRVEVATHDWNSIIHAYCKAGRLDDARRTYRRMIFLRFEPNNQTYLSLINGYVSMEKFFSVLLLWTEVRKKGGGIVKFERELIDAFLYALVKGGFWDATMQVVEKANELKIYIDKWRHKQAFMETHKKLKFAKLKRRNHRKIEALIAFKNWAGLNA